MTDATARFIEELRRTGKAKVDIASYVEAYLAADPTAANDAFVYDNLKAAIDSLETVGSISLAKNRKLWEYRGRHRLPNFITLIKEHSEISTGGPVEWDIRLAPTIRGRKKEVVEDLVKVDTFLKQIISAPQNPIPVNARSLTIFGYEKTLAKYLDNNLKTFFGGALTAPDLACFIPSEIFFSHDVNAEATSGEMLLVENSESYSVFKTWNRTANRYRSVAFGSGNTILKSTPALGILAKEVGASAIRYFGDIDEAGLSIPLQVRAKAATCGIEVPILPAIDLYERCIEVGKAVRWDVENPAAYINKWASYTGPASRAWMADDALYAKIDAIVSAGDRIAQEWLYDLS